MSLRMVQIAAFFLFCSLPALSQVNTGELRLKVTDPTGAAVAASIEVVSQGNQYSLTVATNDQGTADIHRVPYGVYLITTERQGFKTVSKVVQVGSAIPIECAIALEIAPVRSAVTVNAGETLIDPDRPSSIMQIGSKQIEERVLSLPGRSVQDLVNHSARLAL